MKTETEIEINRSIDNVWAVITDIENSVNVISAINDIEILEPGDDDKLGLKWRETRTMMGKEADETMWISEIVEHSHYVVLAQNHGTQYRSTIEVSSNSSDTTTLKMTFSGEPTSLFSKLLSAIMMPFFKGSITKMLHQDLVDLKHHIESVK